LTKNEFSIFLAINRKMVRLSLFPLKYPTLYKSWKEHQAAHWVNEETDMSEDLDQWVSDKLTDAQRECYKKDFAFFGVFDKLVIDAIGSYSEMMDEDDIEIMCFCKDQEARECIHMESYGFIIETLIENENEKDRLNNAVQSFESIRQKKEWLDKWTKSDDVRDRIIANGCAEGIHFMGAFARIFWLKKKGLLPGVVFLNELIIKDERMHRDWAAELLKVKFQDNYPSTERIVEIIRGAVESENIYTRDVLCDTTLGIITIESMDQYIQFIADNFLVQLGCPKIYNVENPFHFMVLQGLKGKTNFFERKVSDYQRFNPNQKREELSKIKWNPNHDC
jgi:ribonucleotide reductase beta subunit family protein with ferritin-like domain